ncbi:DUF6415 family natural product biosynthesis protein [Streptomyces sp. KL116D]|uniref:DUF6415 family natural product biosynthesis protein n=1 Tax=Streptomyces sp. KL116D TaxID=3045152 RepID=UPI0035572723
MTTGSTSESWSPPPDAGYLAHVLARMIAWEPLDMDVLLDDVADALDEVPVAAKDVPPLADRLVAHLNRLGAIAIAAKIDEHDEDVARTISHGARLRAVALPDEPDLAHGHLRRIGWAVSELADQLVKMRCLKGPA